MSWIEGEEGGGDGRREGGGDSRGARGAEKIKKRKREEK